LPWMPDSDLTCKYPSACVLAWLGGL
jgi:hypothetical protein